MARDLVSTKPVRELKFNQEKTKKPIETYDNSKYIQNVKEIANNQAWEGRSIT